MSELFDKWEDDIKKYCEINNLSFEKAKNSKRVIYATLIISRKSQEYGEMLGKR